MCGCARASRTSWPATPEVVVELAGHAALRCHGPTVLRAGIDLLILAVGALADPDTERAIARRRTRARAVRSSSRVASAAWMPSPRRARQPEPGDALHAQARPRLLPPDEASALQEPRELFAGSAREGALAVSREHQRGRGRSWPASAWTAPRSRSSPTRALERNRHEVVAEGDFGGCASRSKTCPPPTTPAPARLVAMSVVQALRRRQARLIIG